MSKSLNLKVAEIRISYSPNISPEDRCKIINSQDAYEYFLRSWDRGTLEYLEEFKVLYLNQAGQSLGFYQVSKGGIDQTVVDIRVLLGVALKSSATQLILCHNHPSGNLKPSVADIQLTKRIREATDIMGIKVLDHLIISPNSYYSMADEGHI